jgi:hypothetical protein
MAITYSPAIVTDGLTFYYDAGNPRSYVGAPLTNLVPNGTTAGYPSSGSGWGTYNTNQYNSNAYFSIGTISSVSGNIVTTSGNHPLRTYDVVTPQTTGGGVTAGTMYLVRKWSNTTFSLHAHNNTQDSTTIFDTAHSNLNNDTRVSVNATSFPTMWWGSPHEPNSGIMKQIIPNGFRVEGRYHDCVRIHWYRPDGVTDGMAYGNEPSITATNTYTATFYYRAATPNAIGKRANWQRWTNGNTDNVEFTLRKNWQQFKHTFTTTQSGATYFYWFNTDMPAQSAFDISEIMLFQGSGSSREYVNSNATRANTQVVFDLGGNNTITANSVTHNSDGTFNFSGANQRLDTSIHTFGQNATWEAWIYCTNGSASAYNMFMGRYLPYFALEAGNKLYFSNSIGGAQQTIQTSATLAANNWYHAAFTTSYNGTNTTMKIYTNGVETASSSFAGAQTNENAGYTFSVGDGYAANWYRFDGKVPMVRIYNRTLTATEILRNFNAHKGRFGL